MAAPNPCHTHPLGTLADLILTAARAAAPGADVHLWVETTDRHPTEPCPWCPDDPGWTADTTVTWRAHDAHLDDSVDCCRNCIPAAYRHALIVAWPDQITIEIALTPTEKRPAVTA